MRFLFPVAIALLTGSAVSAQTVGPTDNDIFAAYCIGVSQAVARDGQAATRRSIECREERDAPAVKDACEFYESLGKEDAAAADAMRQRSNRYLSARGYFTNPDMERASRGLPSIRMAGEQDSQNCGGAAQACLTPLCQQDGTAACFAQCRDRIPTCIKIERCSRVDVLP
jgi:hypothetical protein